MKNNNRHMLRKTFSGHLLDAQRVTIREQGVLISKLMENQNNESEEALNKINASLDFILKRQALEIAQLADENRRLRSCMKYRVGFWMLLPYEIIKKGFNKFFLLKNGSSVICLFDTRKRINIGSEKSLHAYVASEKRAVSFYCEQDVGLVTLLYFLVKRKKPIIINGISCLLRMHALILAVLRPNVVIYLHETKYVLDRVAQEHPLRFRLAKMAIKSCHGFVVSLRQADFLRHAYNLTNYTLVYETASVLYPDPPLPRLGSGAQNVVMVGSIQDRKGPRLFGEVAEMAQNKNLGFSFHWIGACPKNKPLPDYLSKSVTWHGHVKNPTEYLASADIFFLSSCDDPFPLSALEAMILYKKCVVYKNTGIAEILDGIGGCSVFNEYTVDSVCDSLLKVSAEALDEKKIRIINQEISSIYAFKTRVNKALNL